jgi:PleD family two-component response regulator
LLQNNNLKALELFRACALRWRRRQAQALARRWTPEFQGRPPDGGTDAAAKGKCMTWTDLARNGRILVVDDALENIQILHHALREEHEVLFALDGEQAMQVAAAQQPDLILLDAVMPGMDGYAVVAALRAAPRLRDIPVIFVTALSQPEDETRALEAGAVDFISKPFNVAVVRARVRSQLTIKRQADAMRELSHDRQPDRRGQPAQLQRHHRRRMARCARAGLPLSVIMIDVDHFKCTTTITATRAATSACSRWPRP